MDPTSTYMRGHLILPHKYTCGHLILPHKYTSGHLILPHKYIHAWPPHSIVEEGEWRAAFQRQHATRHHPPPLNNTQISKASQRCAVVRASAPPY